MAEIDISPVYFLHAGTKLTDLMGSAIQSCCDNNHAPLSTDEVKLYAPTFNRFPTKVETTMAYIIDNKSYFTENSTPNKARMASFFNNWQSHANTIGSCLVNIAAPGNYKAEAQSNARRTSAAFKKAIADFKNPSVHYCKINIKIITQYYCHFLLFYNY